MTQRALLIFEQAIKSKHTKKVYKYHLNKFKEWGKIKNFDGLLQAPQNDIQILLEDYVMYLKRTISPNAIPTYFSPIELFYVMNDVNLNFKKIRKLFPDKVKRGNERGYTRDEIKTILDSAKTKRNKALVLLLSSSGCRIGAIPEMRLKHLTKIENSYAIKIYVGDKEEDYVFTTPEATKSLDSYLDQRKKDGEYLDGDSPLFRNSYRFGIQKVIPCKIDSLTHVMGRLVRVIDRKKTGKTKRYDIAKNHGFRKFFATVIKSTNGISPTMTEKLINHIGIVQMDSAYFTPSMKEMFEAYKKAIPELIFDDSEQWKVKASLLENENNKLQLDTVKSSELVKIQQDHEEEKEEMRQNLKMYVAKMKSMEKRLDNIYSHISKNKD